MLLSKSSSTVQPRPEFDMRKRREQRFLSPFSLFAPVPSALAAWARALVLNRSCQARSDGSLVTIELAPSRGGCSGCQLASFPLSFPFFAVKLGVPEDGTRPQKGRGLK